MSCDFDYDNFSELSARAFKKALKEFEKSRKIPEKERDYLPELQEALRNIREDQENKGEYDE